MWYEVDFEKLINLLLPVSLRKLTMMSFITALVSPVKDLHYTWRQRRNEDLYKLNHNGQVCYLRAALNDQFDAGQRRIKIMPPNSNERKYIYTEVELKPRYLPLYLYDASSYEDSGVDFVVQVPDDLVFDKYMMNYVINFYKMVTMRYRIITENGLIIE